MGLEHQERALKKVFYTGEEASRSYADGDFLNRLSALDRDKLLASGKSQNFEAGDHFFEQGDPHTGIYIISSGYVRSYYTSPAGREITLGYWNAGHFVGAPQIFSGGQHMWSSIAVERSCGTWLPSGVLKERIYEMPELAIALIEGLEQKGRCYATLLQLIATRSMSKRLAHLLLTLANIKGKTDTGENTLDRQYTHEELASMIGATRQWVSQTLERFEKDHCVARDGSRIILLDYERLLEKSH